MVDVHIIFLAGQSSPILAVHNGAAGDTRCFSLPHSERQGHPDRLNWIDLSLFGLCSAGLPSLGLAVYKSSYKRGEKRREKIGKGHIEKIISPAKTHPQWGCFETTLLFKNTERP